MQVLSKIGFRQWLQEIWPAISNQNSTVGGTSSPELDQNEKRASDQYGTPIDNYTSTNFHSYRSTALNNPQTPERFVYDVDEQSVRMNFQEYSLFPADSALIRVVVTQHPNYYGISLGIFIAHSS